MELLNSAAIPGVGPLSPPPTMCTERLPGSYCPFGDAKNCDCLELFTSVLDSLSDISEDSSYIEELLDELNVSLNDIETSGSFLDDEDVTPSEQRTWNMSAFQLTSTPIRRRSCVNPVLTNVISPDFGEKKKPGKEKPSVFSSEPLSGITSVSKSFDLNDSLDLFGMTELNDDESMASTDIPTELTGTCSMEVNQYRTWDLEGPYVDLNKIDGTRQLVLPDSSLVSDDGMLFF